MRRQHALPVAIFGAGAWGGALAAAVAPHTSTILWGRDMSAISNAQISRLLPYLPNTLLPRSLQLSANFDAVLTHGKCGLLIAAVPVSGLRELAQRFVDCDIPNLIWLCKGFEQDSGMLPHQVVQDELGQALSIGALSGPSFAQEVANGLPCALTIAANSEKLCREVVDTFHGGAIRVYVSRDMTGVEVGGAVKNILAIATGMADGMQLGLNARAALITRGLAEISRLGVALGGKQETFMGLTGIGDLMLTCTGDLSRNRQVGLEIAKGKSLPQVITQLGHVAEGVRCAKTVRTLAKQLKIDMPLVDAVTQVLFDGVPPPIMLDRLLAREPRSQES